MNPGDVIQLTQQALWFVLLLSAPPILVAAAVGLVIAFVQAATQLQEQTLQYVAKFFAIVVTIFITASLLVLFVIVHVAMVILSGPWNNMRSMITGRYAIRKEGPDA